MFFRSNGIESKKGDGVGLVIEIWLFEFIFWNLCEKLDLVVRMCNFGIFRKR